MDDHQEIGQASLGASADKPDGPLSLTTSLWMRVRADASTRTFRSLRHRNYRLYFFGQLISLTGTWMQNAALALLAFQLTHRSLWPGLVSACQFLPTFLFGVWGGWLADRWPKRTLLICTQSLLLLLALVLTAIVMADAATPWILVAISLLNGLVLAADLPGRLAFVMDMVGREDLINAVALNSVLFNTARIIGPMVVGIFLLFWGLAACFFANALSYVAVVWALAQMDVGLVPAATHGRHRGSIRAGLGYLMERPQLAALTALAGILAVCAWPVLPLLPGLSERVLGAGPIGYTSMLTAVGIGALTAAATVARSASVARQRVFIGAGLCCVTAALSGLAFASHLWQGQIFCVALGFGLIMYLSTSQGIVQLGAAEHNRGLIMGIWAMVQSGGLPLGNLVAGDAADRFGEARTLQTCAWISGISTLVLVLGFNRNKEPEAAAETGS
jgi:MFS family permease